MKKTPKTAREMKDTLRYQHMVARLKGLKPYKKAASLMQEIAKGRQWRIDAALEAIAPEDWQQIDVTAVMKQAAMFGRLQTVEKISDTVGFEKGAKEPSTPVQEAFHIAVQHGNYKTADALFERGASPKYLTSNGTLPGLVTAIDENDIRKVNYLVKRGLPGGFVAFAATARNNLKVVEHLVSKQGVDPNYVLPNGDTLLNAAKRVGSTAIEQYLISKGATSPIEMPAAKPEPVAKPVDAPVVVAPVVPPVKEPVKTVTEPVVEVKEPVKTPVVVPVEQPKPVPAVTDKMLKGTKFETNLPLDSQIILSETWKIPGISTEFKDVLRAVKKTEAGLDFALANGRHIEWNRAKEGATEFIGRHDGKADFDTTDAKATVAGAISRGWTAINVHGDPRQQEAMWLEARRQGIKVANFEPAEGSGVKKIWAEELEARRAAARKAAPLAMK